ncbi:SDR family NAD(P)-dependent oxidoreductase [Micromonospora eburnea]|uniref:Acyl transferase domain-containing protein n=1 Tax=Micromonospora eburnea TaxID=227316 RepID=A0A1C6UXV1_9ACTN|nr:type I polyketide synthase [Micromonospora eburnea]SCL58856.1 Acyl transferase domain-containing protein [Micromonospora eburnea]
MSIDEPQSHGVEPIAVVGMACRVPGAKDVNEFWHNLVAGVESVTWFDRAHQLALGVPEHEVDDPHFVPAAPVLDEFDAFDAPLFGLSARDAQVADPQHRLFLELAHSALEHAGYDPFAGGRSVGVYAGTGGETYAYEHLRPSGAGEFHMDLSMWNFPDYVATLTSYKLNLHGPSLTVHTACSTSLVAAHLACEALRGGECDMALAGGVCVELPHGRGHLVLDGGVISRDGHCRPFDAAASGTMWGSGGGIVVLKRLADALADGDHIYGLIRGNAINNDGSAKVSFSAPSIDGQAEVVAQAIELADIDPRTITYVEAHGTGTEVGDPIELAALREVYARASGDRQWCGIGSVKSNIGHLSQGAGVVGLIKTLLALEHGVIPPTINVQAPNPALDLPNSPFYLTTALTKWVPEVGPRRAGVSSFGFGGTNAHLVVEEAPAVVRAPAPEPSRPAQLLTVSAKTETGLATAVARLADDLRTRPDLDLADVAYTLRVGRTEHPHRAAVVATDPADAAAALTDPKRRHTGLAADGQRLVFLFSGQGAQHPGMGAELYAAEPVFRAAVDECVRVLRDHLDHDPLDVILGRTPDAADLLGRTEYTQPALFTVEYALAALWASWGVRPAAMLGHSIGEYVAATLAGVFTLPDALNLVAARGRLMASVPAGAMLAVSRGAEEIAATLPAGLDIATVNGPGICVVAGPSALVEEFGARLRADGVNAKALRTSHAFHSAMMDPILDAFRERVAATPRQAPTVPFLSNRTGDWITAEQATDPDYWVRHLREPVRFGDAVARLVAEDGWTFVECGPGRQLASLVRMQLPRTAPPPLTSLPAPGERLGDCATLYTAAARLWTQGAPLDRRRFAAAERTTQHAAPARRRVALPGYPYERRRHWVERGTPAAVVPRPRRAVVPVDEWFTVPAWRVRPLDAVPAAAPVTGPWLVFTDGEGVADTLRERGVPVVEVRPDAEYARDGSGFRIRPAHPADYGRLLGELAADGGTPQRVVHAWTVGAVPAGRDPEAAWQAQDLGFFSLLHLVQALAATAGPIRLDIVTSGAVDVTGAGLSRPEHATVAGIAKVVPRELPTLTVRHIDADRPASAITELLHDADEELVALRGRRRWVPDHQQVKVPAGSSPVLVERGVYLITGGLGGIGITLAEDFAQRTKARLVLMSRGGLPSRDEWAAYDGVPGRVGRAVAAIRRMEEAGAEVLVCAADVASVDDLRRVRAEALSRFGRIDGLIHAAGLPGGGMAEVKERAVAEEVLAPKLRGTLALQRVFGDLDLDFVVLCSSVTALTGGFGQVDYCAANGFLDAYAQSDHGWRGRVIAVNWGAWREVGMAAETAVPATFARMLGAGAAVVDHPVLVRRQAGEDGDATLSGPLSPRTHWLLDEHRLGGVPLVPGTGHLELVRAAFATTVAAPDPGSAVELRDVTLLQPLSVADGDQVAVRVTVTGGRAGTEVEVASEGTAGTLIHARGQAAWVAGAPPVRDLAAVRARCGQERVYDPDTERGGSALRYGSRWRSLHRVRLAAGTGSGPVEALLELAVPEPVRAELSRWPLHPALLDEAVSFGWLGDARGYLPFGYGRVRVWGPLPERLFSHVVPRSHDHDELVADVTLLDETGRVVAEIVEFTLRRVDATALTDSARAEPAGSAARGAAGAGDGPGIRPADGAEALHRLLAADLGPQVVVSARSLDDALHAARELTVDAVEAQPDTARPQERPTGTDYVAPRGELEAALAQVWGRVLGVDQVGAEDDFFELGGNSLVAVQLIGQVRTALGVKLPMRSLFAAPTVAAMAELVSKTDDKPDGSATPTNASTTIPRLARPGR